MIRLGMKHVFAETAENALRLGAKKKISEEARRVGMRRLAVDRGKAQGGKIFVHTHVLDRARVLELVLDITDGNGDFTRSQRLDRIRQTSAEPRFLFGPAFHNVEPFRS
jgi:hypothetical protein